MVCNFTNHHHHHKNHYYHIPSPQPPQELSLPHTTTITGTTYHLLCVLAFRIAHLVKTHTYTHTYTLTYTPTHLHTYTRTPTHTHTIQSCTAQMCARLFNYTITWYLSLYYTRILLRTFYIHNSVTPCTAIYICIYTCIHSNENNNIPSRTPRHTYTHLHTRLHTHSYTRHNITPVSLCSRSNTINVERTFFSFWQV